MLLVRMPAPYRRLSGESLQTSRFRMWLTTKVHRVPGMGSSKASEPDTSWGIRPFSARTAGRWAESMAIIACIPADDRNADTHAEPPRV